MDNKEHTLLCIMGRTAAGKDRLANRLHESMGLNVICSYTTRPRRENEGDTHIFTTKEIYKQMKAEHNVAAYTEIAGNYYWTTIDQLYENDIYIIDPYGVETLRSLNLPHLRLVTIFINAPDDIREKRALQTRKDDKVKFRNRNIDERNQFRDMLKNAKFDYAVSNVDFAKAYSVLKWITITEGVWKNHQEDATND